jgi:hypothetical protein
LVLFVCFLSACDPFAKKKSSDPSKLQYNESPDDYEERRKKKDDKLKRKIAKINSFDELGVPTNERILQQQALRELKIMNSPYIASKLEPSKPANSSNTKDSKKKEVSYSTLFSNLIFQFSLLSTFS